MLLLCDLLGNWSTFCTVYTIVKVVFPTWKGKIDTKPLLLLLCFQLVLQAVVSASCHYRCLYRKQQLQLNWLQNDQDISKLRSKSYNYQCWTLVGKGNVIYMGVHISGITSSTTLFIRPDIVSQVFKYHLTPS